MAAPLLFFSVLSTAKVNSPAGHGLLVNHGHFAAVETFRLPPREWQPMRWKHVTWERYGRILDDETKHKQLLKARMLAQRRRRIILVLERAGMAGCLARPPPGVAPFGCDWLSPAVLRRSPPGCIPGPTNVVLMTALRLEIKRTLHSRRMLHGPLVVDVPHHATIESLSHCRSSLHGRRRGEMSLSRYRSQTASKSTIHGDVSPRFSWSDLHVH